MLINLLVFKLLLAFLPNCFPWIGEKVTSCNRRIICVDDRSYTYCIQFSNFGLLLNTRVNCSASTVCGGSILFPCIKEVLSTKNVTTIPPAREALLSNKTLLQSSTYEPPKENYVDEDMIKLAKYLQKLRNLHVFDNELLNFIFAFVAIMEVL